MAPGEAAGDQHGREQRRPRCTECGQTGHLAHACPHDGEAAGDQHGREQRRPRCTECGQTGHLAHACPHDGEELQHLRKVCGAIVVQITGQAIAPGNHAECATQNIAGRMRTSVPEALSSVQCIEFQKTGLPHAHRVIDHWHDENRILTRRASASCRNATRALSSSVDASSDGRTINGTDLQRRDCRRAASG